MSGSEATIYDGRPDRLLVISAHPGDADRAIAGSVAGWVRRGTAAHLVCCTSGDGSADDASSDGLKLAARREAEQRAAAALLGYEAVTFLHRPEGALLNDLALREQLVRVIRSFRPDAIAAPDPTVVFAPDGGVQHVDHREAGMAGVDAADPAASNAMAFPHLVTAEGLQPHRVKDLLLYWPARPQTLVDIAASMDAKLAALGVHLSQPGDADELEQHVRQVAQRAGAEVGIQLAESFHLVPLG
ncbi:MAG: PIG-L deacetylase family protein [Chloroflexota bacterium]